MLSSDVAKLYQVETRRINEVIKRNIKRFPDTFCFQLTENEFYNLRSQFAISSENSHGGVRYLPYVFIIWSNNLRILIGNWSGRKLS